MMQSTATYRDGVQFAVETRGHTLVCDQPGEAGGEDGGMTPPELMLASLATCAGYYVLQYLKFRSLPTGGFSVRVEAEKAFEPARLGVFRILIDQPALSDPRHVAGMRRAAEKCLIHNTLLHTPEIVIEVSSGLPSKGGHCETAGGGMGERTAEREPGGLQLVR